MLTPIAFSLNAALAQDPETKTKLTQFESRCIAIKIKDFNQTIVMSVKQQQLYLTTSSEQPIDLTITGDALTLAKLGSDPESLFSADIDINGDVQFAKQLRDLLEGFDFDWEAQLARITGDTLAYPIAHGIRQSSSWAKKNTVSMQETIAEYLREESRLLLDKSEVKSYLQDIDILRADFDRLEARIKRL